MTLRNPEWIRKVSDELEDAPADEILSWAWQRLGPDVAIGTAFGASGLVMLDLRQQAAPDMPVFFLDTGYQFQETLEVKARVEERYGIEIESVKPLLTVAQQDAEFGLALYDENPDRCCHIRKVEPLQRKLLDLDGWVSSLRRDQSKSREEIDILELHQTDSGRRLVKVNPMAQWSRKQIWDYILEHELPYNPLMNQGYPSVGCRPCTHAVGQEAGERDGRWTGSGKTECGIHTFLDGSTVSEVADREPRLQEAVD